MLSTLTASYLIALDKCPGVRPIGIGETVQRIIGKAILSVIKMDIQEDMGSFQFCTGQEAGCEAAIHAMHPIFQDDNTKGVLLADASNAFNSLNGKAALINIATSLHSSHSSDTNIYIQRQCLIVH